MTQAQLIIRIRRPNSLQTPNFQIMNYYYETFYLLENYYCKTRYQQTMSVCIFIQSQQSYIQFQCQCQCFQCQLIYFEAKQFSYISDVFYKNYNFCKKVGSKNKINISKYLEIIFFLEIIIIMCGNQVGLSKLILYNLFYFSQNLQGMPPLQITNSTTTIYANICIYISKQIKQTSYCQYRKIWLTFSL
eukprot:TRINITY_DN15422_c0_g1_i6.p3 TRINITY_DN15422_c0_g1~~TRINITY_DN15422_c0_g1_i6.p3  ORF type:complete len:189 (+),score=-19.95 TRINITY_DN15422_c0_g1_i6:603-1169(+)